MLTKNNCKLRSIRMSTMIKRYVICIVIFLLLLCACNATNKDCKFLTNSKIQSSIMIHDKVLFKTHEKIVKDGNIIGQLKGIKKEGYLPDKEQYGTQDLENEIGQNIYKANDNMYYIVVNGEKITYQYLSQMELGDSIPLKEHKSEEEIPVPDAVPPHFVYKEMMYSICDSTGLKKLPSCFQSVGEITEQFHLANKNFTGNLEIGSELYAMDSQNYYMLVKNDGYYYVYANSGYTLHQ